MKSLLLPIFVALLLVASLIECQNSGYGNYNQNTTTSAAATPTRAPPAPFKRHVNQADLSELLLTRVRRQEGRNLPENGTSIATTHTTPTVHHPTQRPSYRYY